MAQINVYTTTFNCARELIDIDCFAANLLNGIKTALPPDLIILCLQEIAPIGYSFLGGSLLAPYIARFAKALHTATSAMFGDNNIYGHLTTQNVGMTAIIIFARLEIRSKIRWIETGGVGVGLWEMGNKGAVGVRLGFESGGQETILTAVAAHLAPMEEAWKRRNEDWKSICGGLIFERGNEAVQRRLGDSAPESEPLLSTEAEGTWNKEAAESSMFTPASHLFFAGDLNYRTSDHRPDSGSHKDWPQPVSSTSDVHHYSHLLRKDQLSRERSQGHTLHGLSEASISFPPTYKYSSAARKRAADQATQTKTTGSQMNANGVERRSDVEDEVWLWAQHRTPSWCDRILFLESAKPTVHSYTALPVQPTSDHQPVALSCSVALKSLDIQVDMPFEIRKDWRKRRAAARRLEILVGIAAYLGFTWEGQAVLVGTIVGVVGGYLALRALLAR